MLQLAFTLVCVEITIRKCSVQEGKLHVCVCVPQFDENIFVRWLTTRLLRLLSLKRVTHALSKWPLSKIHCNLNLNWGVFYFCLVYNLLYNVHKGYMWPSAGIVLTINGNMTRSYMSIRVPNNDFISEIIKNYESRWHDP